MGLIVILLFVLMIGGVFGVVPKLMRTKQVNSRGRYSYSLRVRMVFGGYLAILILCLLLNVLLPVKGLAEMEKVGPGKPDHEPISLYDTALSGDIDRLDEGFLRKKWNFDYQGKKLLIVSSDDTFQNTSIVVKRKEQNDGKIEAAFYMTHSSVNGRDISRMVRLPKLDVERDKLLLINSPKNEMRFSEFTNVFSVRQFTGGSLFSHGSTFQEGQSILYLRIPKDLELETSGLDLQYAEN